MLRGLIDRRDTCLQESDSAGTKFEGALINAAIFVVIIGVMTFVLFLLFKYGVSRLLPSLQTLHLRAIVIHKSCAICTLIYQKCAVPFIVMLADSAPSEALFVHYNCTLILTLMRMPQPSLRVQKCYWNVD